VALAQARVAWRVDADAQAARAALQRAAEADDRPAARALQLRQAATIAFEADRDTAGSEQLLQQALRLLHGDAQVSRHLLRALRYNLAIAAVHDGRPAEALPLLDALVDEAAAAGHARLRSDALNSRGSAHQALGRRDAAEADTRAALAEAWGRLETESALYALWNLGLMASERGDAERAARLMAFADRFWRIHFGSLAASDARDVARLRRQCRRQLGRATGQRCWDEGGALPLAAAVALALAPSAG
jgi:tetratricopeptide (TPR) repeat protein